MKSSANTFYFFTCILPDYVAHESLKEFWKNIYFENMRAGFHLRCQNSLRFVTPEMMHFQPWKKIFSSWSNLDFNILSTSKWPSGPQFCERLSCNWQINDQKWSKNGHLWVIDFQDFFFQNGNRTVCVLCCSFWSNQDLDMFSTSKWLSALNFFERLLCSWRKNDQKWS